MLEHSECVWCEGWYNQSNSHFRMIYISFSTFTGRDGEMLSGLGLKWMDNIHDGCLDMAKKGEVKPQDRPAPKTIVQVNFEEELPGYRKVMVYVGEDGRIKSDAIHAFSYYTDELVFSQEELIGLTLQQARDLFHKKDVRYLQS